MKGLWHLSDQINAGKTIMDYDEELAYKGKKLSVRAYHQWYFEDKSGMDTTEPTACLRNLHTKWVQKVVVEYGYTQPKRTIPFLNLITTSIPDGVVGMTAITNNGEYITGVFTLTEV